MPISSKKEESPVLPETLYLAESDGLTNQFAAVKDESTCIMPVVHLQWDPQDPTHPRNWSSARKAMTVFAAVFTTIVAALNTTSIALLNPAGSVYFGVSPETFTLGLTIHLLAIGLTPLVLAPLSEIVGRNVIFQVSSVLVMLLFIPQALSDSFAGYLVARWFQGMSSSVGNSMVGGVIADIYEADTRGNAMNWFSLLIFLGQGFGGLIFGFVGSALGIQWSYGILAFVAAFSCLLNAVFLRETRSDVILSRRAVKLTKATGKSHVTDLSGDGPNLRQSIIISVTRPIQFLLTEPIVTALSIWIGFAWACVFLGGTSVSLVFAEYGWSWGAIGAAQMVIGVGGMLGFVSNMHQQRLYTRAAEANDGHAEPEARLYWAAVGGILFPLGLYVFAWTGRPEVHWVVPMIGLCMVNWGVYAMFSGVFNYLADAYETYSSSAQACQSLARNVIAGLLPLCARRLYISLGYAPASTLVASVALILGAFPFVLIKYGKALRAKSRVAREISLAKARPSI